MKLFLISSKATDDYLGTGMTAEQAQQLADMRFDELGWKRKTTGYSLGSILGSAVKGAVTAGTALNTARTGFRAAKGLASMFGVI